MPGLMPSAMNGYRSEYARGGGPQYMANGGAFHDPRDEPSREPIYSRDLRPNRRMGPEEPLYSGRNIADDPYSQDDHYFHGHGEDLYRLPSKHGHSDNRFNDVLPGDQNSLADFAQHSNEPVFEVDHLATYTAGTKSGYINVEDGLQRLRKMENTTGIWTMRCILIVERRNVVILDKSTGEELEKFPIECCVGPTAVFKNDRREVYNNLILFTVVEDPRRKNNHGDLHIFQSIKTPSQEIVDEINAAKDGRSRLSGHGGRIPPPPIQPAPEPPRGYDPYSFSGMRENLERSSGLGRSQRPLLHNGGQNGGQNEVLEKDVQLLNHCFDDIERFVARLQQAAEAFKELERRKRERGNKGKKRQSGDGMLTQRSRPPPAADFVDIFQKFKFSFNLLAKLKAHIHDPNAPELVHFLFTPLSLIYEASRDPFHGNRYLADSATSPAITYEAKQLLLNCLTSKEIELWQALGPRWTSSSEEMRGPPPNPYYPTFYDGTRVSPSMAEDLVQVPLEDAVLTHHNQILSRAHDSDPGPPMPERVYAREIDRDHYPVYHEERRPSPRVPSPRMPSPRPPSPPRHDLSNDSETGFKDYVEQHTDRPQPVSVRPPPGASRDEENAAYFEEIKRNGLGPGYMAQHDRTGKNTKEITVKKGDILQVIDRSRKWWKVRNYKGEIGYAPFTILDEMKNDDYRDDINGDGNSGNYNSYLPNDQPPAPPMAPPAPDMGRGRQQAKRGDFRYF